MIFKFNPKWQQIAKQHTRNLQELTKNIFRQKLQSLCEDLTKTMLGKPKAVLHTTTVVNGQLQPKCYILLIFGEKCRLKSVANIDEFISAEIPDPQKYPRLHQKVIEFMIHKEFSMSRMNKLNCRHYPKQFNEQTIVNHEASPRYKRSSPRNGGQIHQVRTKNGKIKTVDNRWILPYNPKLLMKYNAQIRIEVCTVESTIQYLDFLKNYQLKSDKRKAWDLTKFNDLKSHKV